MRASRIAAAPLPPVTLVDRVHQRIWSWINTGKLKPGDWLRIQELARALRVSETPVREALIRLQQNGIVESIPHVGTRVRRFTPRDIQEVFDLREALECYALQRAAANLSNAALRRLRRRLKHAEGRLNDGNLAPALAADMELHAELVRAAGNSRICTLLANLRDQIQMFAGFGNRTPDGPRRFLKIHLRIVDLLLKGDSAAATRLMSEHMRLATRQAVRGYFGSGGSPGTLGESETEVLAGRRPPAGRMPARPAETWNTTTPPAAAPQRRGPAAR